MMQMAQLTFLGQKSFPQGNYVYFLFFFVWRKQNGRLNLYIYSVQVILYFMYSLKCWNYP